MSYEIPVLVRVLSVAHIWECTYVVAADMSADVAMARKACQHSDTAFYGVIKPSLNDSPWQRQVT